MSVTDHLSRFGVLADMPMNARLVFDEEGPGPSRIYTAGLAKRPAHAYELATTGLDPAMAYSVVCMAVKQLVDEHLVPAEGLPLVRVLLGRSVRLHRVQEPQPFRGHAPGTPVWQVLVPDKWGRFPGDPHYIDYEPPFSQPLL
jgi:hypothetical protein